MQTRREFLATIGIGGVLGTSVMSGQTAGLPLPSVDLGEPLGVVAIRNVTVIDMTGRRPLKGATVMLDGDRILSVGYTGGQGIARVIDGTGKYLIPGLWDMHTHPHPRTLAIFIANGVTGIRTMRAQPIHLDARDEVARGQRVGPHMVAGIMLDGPAQNQPDEDWRLVSTPDKARAAVRRASREGYDFIKVYNRLPRDAYFAIAQEARVLGVPVVGHVPWSVTPAECSAAGQRSIEHTYLIGQICIDRNEEWRRLVAANPSAAPGFAEFQPSVDSFQLSRATSLVHAMRKNGTWLCPTLIASALIASGPRNSDEPRLKYVPPLVRDAFRKHPVFPSTPRNRAEHAQYMQLVGMLHERGVGILAGSDAPADFMAFEGFSLHDELQLLVDAGFTPLDALRAATSAPAEFFGIRKELGTVEAGKRAELVLLDADPLADIRNTQRIDAVFTGGRVYRRDALDKMLDFVETDAKS
jgi:cytosine/adenosine deaminase-related metal-dependent hydrolase